MDNASVHSDEDTLAPMREPAARRNQQQPQQQLMTRRGTLMTGPGGGNPGAGSSRKSISLGARGAAMLSHALAAGASGGRRRSRGGGGDPTSVARLENTYRMQPKDDERFSRSRVHPLVLDALEEALAGFDCPAGGPAGGRKACEVAQAVRDRVRESGFDRYKLVVGVCLFPKAVETAAAAVATRAVWAVDCGDCFVECRYQNRTLTAVATVHAFYYE